VSDVHYTPAWVTQLALDEGLLGEAECHDTWLEPAAGNGAICRVLRAHYGAGFPGPHLWAVEIDPNQAAALSEVTTDFSIGNFLGMYPQDVGFADLVVGNPPFSKALEFVQQGLAFAPRVLFLLRLGFLEGADRSEWMRDHVPDVFVIPDRISFYGSSDNAAYAWFEWRREIRRTGSVRILATVPLSQRVRGPRREPQPTLFER